MTDNTMKFLTNEKDDGNRLDIFLSNRIKNLTRSNLKKVIESKKVRVNDLIVSSPSKKVKNNQTILVSFDNKDNKVIKPYNIKLDILYEDKDILIVNKPSGMVVHPGAGNLIKH